MLQTSSNNKDIEKYKSLVPENQTTVKGPIKSTGINTNIRRKQRRAHFSQKRIATQIKSNERFTDNQVNVISKGLKFVPTPVTDEKNIRRQLLQGCECVYSTYSTQKVQTRTHFTSNQTIPPVKKSVALESYLESVKINLRRSNHQTLKTICQTTNTKPL